MKKFIFAGTTASLLSGIVSFILYNNFSNDLYLTLTITFFTTFYHFIMRVIVGSTVVLIRKNKTSKDLMPIRLGKAEQRLYEFIRVKQRKKFAPTYNKESFDIRTNSLEVVMHNMTNAEYGHIIIVLLSFIPVLFSKSFGGFVPFILSSLFAAFFDLQFVIIQRYNRSRLGMIISRKNVAERKHYAEKSVKLIYK